MVEIVGGQSALAGALGVKPQAVQQWVMRNRVPPERVLAIEGLVKARVTRYELRPDVYGPAPENDCHCR
ncbi:MAG TPA: Cro/CI family transcriptional regulator [Burkholderiales bacterium]|nr:Cro/CI family transcriptional regulator [Burkholderiales bacterium]